MGKPDLSWIIVAINRNDQGVVLDASQGFYDVDLLGVNGDDADDCGIYMPRPPLSIPYPPGVYRITKIKISPGGWSGAPDSQEFDGAEISGAWEQITTWECDPERDLFSRAHLLHDMIGGIMLTPEHEKLREGLLTSIYESVEATITTTQQIVDLLSGWDLKPKVAQVCDRAREALNKMSQGA